MPKNNDKHVVRSFINFEKLYDEFNQITETNNFLSTLEHRDKKFLKIWHQLSGYVLYDGLVEDNLNALIGLANGDFFCKDEEIERTLLKKVSFETKILIIKMILNKFTSLNKSYIDESIDLFRKNRESRNLIIHKYIFSIDTHGAEIEKLINDWNVFSKNLKSHLQKIMIESPPSASVDKL